MWLQAIHYVVVPESWSSDSAKTSKTRRVRVFAGLFQWDNGDYGAVICAIICA